MRLVLFGSGSPASVGMLAALARGHEVVGVVTPAGGRGARALLDRARTLRVPELQWTRTDSGPLVGWLRERRPDLLVVATFPWRIPADAVASARLGGVNAHPSLLPRHRGPAPLFWSYVADDAETGVTVHALADAFDSGAVFAQQAVPIARGRSVVDLYSELTDVAARLTVEVVDALEAGRATARAQDEAQATHEPAPGPFRVPAGSWSAERVHHVLAGLGAIHHDLLADARGRVVPHGRARGFAPGAPVRPEGTVEATPGGLRVHCADGVVDVARAAWRVRARALLRRLRDAL